MSRKTHLNYAKAQVSEASNYEADINVCIVDDFDEKDKNVFKT